MTQAILEVTKLIYNADSLFGKVDLQSFTKSSELIKWQLLDEDAKSRTTERANIFSYSQDETNMISNFRSTVRKLGWSTSKILVFLERNRYNNEQILIAQNYPGYADILGKIFYLNSQLIAKVRKLVEDFVSGKNKIGTEALILILEETVAPF